jgi:hypothetical protein
LGIKIKEMSTENEFKLSIKSLEQLRIEIDHIIDSGANYIRFTEMIEHFVRKHVIPEYIQQEEKIYLAEFMQWLLKGSQFIIIEDATKKIIAMNIKYGNILTIEKVYQYWLINIKNKPL